jgi:glutaryl-CoA dehydrogenase
LPATQLFPDYFELDASLTEEEKQVRATVRRFVDERFLPAIGEHFEHGTFPLEVVPELARLGMFGMHLKGYGCPGLNSVSYGLACQELERGDSGLRSFVSVQGSLSMFAIYAFGSEEQKQRWLPAMARGEALGCFGLTEPDFGSDPSGMRTTARRAGDDWVITGSKRWITNGHLSQVAVVWAKTDQGIRGFLVERETRGFSAHPIEHKLSMRASATSELTLDEVRVPEAHRLPGAAGLRAPLSCLNEARFGIVWGALGAAVACYAAALRYATERVQFGRPIAQFQLTQAKLVEMLTEITKGQLLAWQLARLKDEGHVRPTQISLAKRNNVQVALEIARSARSILGANGISLEYPVVRHLVNLETLLTYEGTHEVHTLAVGQDITGLNAFS